MTDKVSRDKTVEAVLEFAEASLTDHELQIL